jgi:RNA polymerase sigma factor (sigma-70 family)
MDFPEQFDVFARRYLTSAALRLDATVPCVPCGTDDYLQDLQLNLCRRMSKFDSKRSAWSTFVRLVTDHRAIELRQRCYAGRCQAIAPVASTERIDEFLDRAPSANERRMIEIDIAAWLETLDPDEKMLCRLLMNGSVAAAARELNAPRTTVMDKISRMRKRFESSSFKDLAPQRKKLPTPAKGLPVCSGR